MPAARHADDDDDILKDRTLQLDSINSCSYCTCIQLNFPDQFTFSRRRELYEFEVRVEYLFSVDESSVSVSCGRFDKNRMFNE